MLMTLQEVVQRQGLSLSGTKSHVQREGSKLKAVFRACCAMEFDRRGKVANYDSRQSDCRAC
jgi:RNA polymerase sigma-70 factor, ECF subfamily